MRKTIMTFAFILAGFLGVSAQETYVGVQYTRANPDVRQPNFRYDDKTDQIGVNASLTSYLTENVGITGEVTANGNSKFRSSQNYTFMGGLTLKSKSNKAQPFVRALAGLGVQRAENELGGRARTDSGFTYALGGGLDYKVGKRVSFRVLQADFVQSRVFGTSVNSVRLGTGIVF